MPARLRRDQTGSWQSNGIGECVTALPAAILRRSTMTFPLMTLSGPACSELARSTDRIRRLHETPDHTDYIDRCIRLTEIHTSRQWAIHQPGLGSRLPTRFRPVNMDWHRGSF